MPPPRDRADLIEQIDAAFGKLRAEMTGRDEAFGALPCTEGANGGAGWTIRELLAVRAWWTEQVPLWIEAGARGEAPLLPAEGYRWSETPQLNDSIVAASSEDHLAQTWKRLEEGVVAVRAAIARLSDRELLEVGIYTWADRWPVARWITINTVRQYTTARAHIRRAAKRANE